MDHQSYGVRPRTASEILTQTAAIYRNHFETIVGVAAAILIPLTALQILLFAVIIDSNDILAIFLLQIISWVIGVGTVAAAMAGVTSATTQIVVNGKTSVLEAFDYGMPRIVTTMKAAYLIYLIFTFLCWTVIGIPIALFLSVAWLVTLQVVIVEGTGARFALGRSWELTRNNRLRVLGMTVLLWAITGVIMFFFLLPMFALMFRPVITGTTSPAPIFAWILVGLFTVVGSVLVVPLQYLAWTLIYLDLRARNDTLTIDPMPDAFKPAPATVPNMD